MGRQDGSDILYGKRQSPKILKEIDATASEINKKIRMRGIARGMVCVQEDMNREALKLEKLISRAYTEPDVEKRLDLLYRSNAVIKAMWVDVRYMFKQHSLTSGEIGELADHVRKAQSQLEDWTTSTEDRQCQGKS